MHNPPRPAKETDIIREIYQGQAQAIIRPLEMLETPNSLKKTELVVSKKHVYTLVLFEIQTSG